MKIFLDSANLSEIGEFVSTGLIDGITTNPSLIAKSKCSFDGVISEICSLVRGPVSFEVIATDYQNMIVEGLKLAKVADNVVVKLPLTVDGLRACGILSKEHNIKVNVTLCFSSSQAILAAKAGACFISPFIGRLDDLGYDGMGLIEDICNIYSKYDNFTTRVLVASVRSPLHVVKAAKAGADIVTVPSSVFKQMFLHPLTSKGLADFLKDWEMTGQKFLESSDSCSQ